MKIKFFVMFLFLSFNIYPQCYINQNGQTIETRFSVPKGFSRVEVQQFSFADYLRKLPLKPHNSEVKYYDGRVKQNYGVYAAVINMRIGAKNLHQCADAIMRLRAEYFWNKKLYDRIHFNFTNGFRVNYTEWMKGRRMVISGNKTYWNNRNAPSNTYSDFWDYMELIFTYAGTLSLSREMKTVDVNDMKIGDVFIVGGSPGHAVLIVDMAENLKREKVFMLAQSYMPAQEMHVLCNQNNSQLSPWYALDSNTKLYTPEWVFDKNAIKRFAN